MKILGYGEDALTLWALQNKLPFILQMLHDSSFPSQCEAFFRPSFGRRGGKRSSQFGEFDFILLADDCLYLGESKWDKSSEKIMDRVLAIRDEQQLRHEIFKFYVEEWVYGDYSSWQEFIKSARAKLEKRGITKPLAPENSLLAFNLQTVLGAIKKHYEAQPAIRNVLLYFHEKAYKGVLPKKAGKDFIVISIDYSYGLLGNFVNIGY